MAPRRRRRAIGEPGAGDTDGRARAVRPEVERGTVAADRDRAAGFREVKPYARKDADPAPKPEAHRNLLEASIMPRRARQGDGQAAFAFGPWTRNSPDPSSGTSEGERACFCPSPVTLAPGCGS